MTKPDRPIRVAVVDDEPVARRILVRLLANEPGVELVGDLGSGHEAIELLTGRRVDVVFLDVHMPGLGGFEVLAGVPRPHLPLVVFVTAHDEHAIRAFEVGAVDYLLKPFDDERFRATFERVRRRLEESDVDSAKVAVYELARQLLLDGPDGEPADVADPRPGRIAVRSGKRIEFVEIDDVEWIEAENYYVRLHTADRSYLMRESLTRLGDRLDPRVFVRVHRSAIVRISIIRELRPGSGGRSEAVLANGARVPISRSRRAQLLRALGVDPTE
ncbi:MAG: LytTR family DNA-binding domain-containing protein [Gemmatimonadota bacterium]